MATPNGLNPDFYDVNVTNSLKVNGTTVIDSNGALVQTSQSFGDAVTDTNVFKSRISTGTVAGTAIDATSAYLYGEGLEWRWKVSNWTGVGSSFKSMYVRAETGVDSSGKDMFGMELYGVTNNYTVGNLKGLLSYAYIKGTSAKTVGTAYGIHGELTFDASSATNTITTELSAGLLKITGGVVDDATKIHGLIIRAGDMDGNSPTYGNGILIEDDSAMSGTIKYTTGINLSAHCSTAIKYGTSGGEQVMVLADKFISSYLTNSTTDGGTSFEPFLIDTTLTGAGQVGGRGKFIMRANAALGGWSNALKAEVVYGATGKTTGLGSAMVAEMTLSAGTVDGNYAPLELELNIPSGASTGTDTAMMYLSAQGADVGTFDTNGYLLKLAGLTAGSGKLLQTGNTLGTPAATMKVKIGSTTYYLPVYATEITTL